MRRSRTGASAPAAGSSSMPKGIHSPTGARTGAGHLARSLQHGARIGRPGRGGAQRAPDHGAVQRPARGQGEHVRAPEREHHRQCASLRPVLPTQPAHSTQRTRHVPRHAVGLVHVHHGRAPARHRGADARGRAQARHGEVHRFLGQEASRAARAAAPCGSPAPPRGRASHSPWTKRRTWMDCVPTTEHQAPARAGRSPRRRAGGRRGSPRRGRPAPPSCEGLARAARAVSWRATRPPRAAAPGRRRPWRK
jgi:hypothetical protein